MLENEIFSKAYRKMIRDLKAIVKMDAREETKLSDIRTGEGAGRKGSADRPDYVPKSRQSRGNSGTKSDETDRKEEENSDTGAASPSDATV